MRHVKPILILSVLTVLFLLIGDWIGGHSGIFIAGVFSILTIIAVYAYSDRELLNAIGAKKESDSFSQELSSVVKTLAEKIQLTAPTIYYIDSEAANACVVGRSSEKTFIIVTKGLLSLLNKDELTAVLAREIAWCKKENLFPNTAGAMMADFLFKIVSTDFWKSMIGIKTSHNEINLQPLGAIAFFIAPIAALFVRATTSSRDTLEADKAGAVLCENPAALASALQKLEENNRNAPFPTAEVHPEMAGLFVVNPIKNTKMSRLFGIQPNVSERIQQLNVLASSSSSRINS